MIGEVAALKALAGYRGRPAGDLDALADALVALSQLAVADGPAVLEAEVNPLMVLGQGRRRGRCAGEDGVMQPRVPGERVEDAL